jgi:SAM-dependent methyltransferase
MLKLKLRRIMRSVERSVRHHGIVGGVVHLGATIVEKVKKTRGEAAEQAHKNASADAVEDADFDARFNVKTGGVIPQTELDVDAKTWINASAYVPTSPVDFDEGMRDSGLVYEETTFIDVGCGKGRALLMAAAFPFRRIVGVEFSASLADIARDNVRRYTGPRACQEITIETMDATKYVFPDGPLVVFMYHPFDEKVMAPFAERVAQLVRENAERRILVVYLKPKHRELWDRSTTFALKREGRRFATYESKSGDALG